MEISLCVQHLLGVDNERTLDAEMGRKNARSDERSLVRAEAKLNSTEYGILECFAIDEFASGATLERGGPQV